MSLGSFINSMEMSIKLLKEYSLYKGKGDWHLKNHSSEFIAISRENRHTDIYSTAIKNRDYEILLVDESIFQFTYGKDFLRFCFIQNPYKHPDILDYINSIYSSEELIDLKEGEIQSLISSIDDYEYEQFLSEQDFNLESHIIRYDYSQKGYAPLIHSCSHIHIGLNENLRIPISKILTPLKFILFCIKNTYYDNWKKSFVSGKTSEFVRNCKAQCGDLPKEFWQVDETYELHLI